MLPTNLAERLHDRAVQISRPKFGAAILGYNIASLGAHLDINFVCRADFFERVRISKIEAVTKINDGTRHNGVLDLTPLELGLFYRPPFGARMTVLPKVNAMPKPVPGVFAGFKVIFA